MATSAYQYSHMVNSFLLGITTAISVVGFKGSVNEKGAFVTASIAEGFCKCVSGSEGSGLSDSVAA